MPNASPYMFEVADFNGDGLLDLYVVDDGSDKLLTATEHVADTQLGFVTVNLGFPSSNGFGEMHAADLDLDGDLDVVVSDVDVTSPVQQRTAHGDLRERGRHAVRPLWHDHIRLGHEQLRRGVARHQQRRARGHFSGKCAGYEVIMSDNCALASSSADTIWTGCPTPATCAQQPRSRLRSARFLPDGEHDHSMARQWNDMLLESIRPTLPAPLCTPETCGTAPC